MSQHILLIEDDPDVVYLLRLFLEKRHYKVTVTLDASTAIHKLMSLDQPIVILDIYLPSGSGFDILTHIRTTNDLQQTPVIVLTCALQSVCEPYLFGDQRSCYLAKPFSFDALTELIERSFQLYNEV